MKTNTKSEHAGKCMAAMICLPLVAFAAGASPNEQEWEPDVPEMVSHEIFRRWNFLTPTGRFPALSNDGTQVAILYGGLYFDGDRSMLLDIWAVSDGRREYQHILQHGHEATDEPPYNAARIRDRIIMANIDLDNRGGFVPMTLLYQLGFDPHPAAWPQRCDPEMKCAFEPQSPGDPRRSPARIVIDGIEIHFDFQTGTLTIENDDSVPGSGLVLHWPVSDTRGARGNVALSCNVQPVPRQGWVSPTRPEDDSRVLVLRIGHLVDDLDCTQPDDWWVGRLSG